ncbi:MAG: hypothetical protein J6B04_01980 [Clostridia bacterium]|nr:hypothetical protein [Clostridia bacterium]
MPKPLIANLPYPSLELISEDCYSLRVISPAYASSTSELNTILQYVYHSFHLNAKGFNHFAEDLQSIAVAEMMHLKLLGETILALGALPVFAQNPSTAFNFYSAKFVSYSTSPVCMIEDDIRGEIQAIKGYKKMLALLKSERVKAVIYRIILDEELHLEKLKEILFALKG